MGRMTVFIKEMIAKRKKSLFVRLVTAFVMISMLVTGLAFASYSEDVTSGLATNLIRLHVLANSDSEADQALKRDVRDVILQYMRSEFNDTVDVEHTKLLINKNLDKINQLAEEEIKRQGKSYKVKTMLGNFPFPTKVYGDIKLPAGNYQALRVVIGNGEGANWWCVLFPPLCFVDATHGTVPDKVKEDLKNVLTDEEYNIVATAKDDSEIPVKVKFKVVEVFQDSKIKFTGMVSKIFKKVK